MLTAVIIGGGPAGTQCALWLSKLGYEVLIVEKTTRLGGLQSRSPYINDWIVGMVNLSGQEIAKNIQAQITKMNIAVLYNATLGNIKKFSSGFEVEINNQIFRTHNLIIATGVKPRIDNFQKSKNVIIGPGEEIYNKCFRNKNVAILGGGDNAAENYAFILEKNPAECHVYARTIRARYNLWNKVKSSDVFLGNYKADQDSMTVIYNQHKRAYDYFVILYGWEANIPAALSPFKSQMLNAQGFITVDTSRRTNISNIFAAGEVTHLLHPCVVTAMADGVVVAKAIQLQFKK